MGMVNNSSFNEYNCWLQPCGGFPLSAYSVVGPEAAAFALSELRLGMTRLYGRDIYAKDADFSVDFKHIPGLRPDSYRIHGDNKVVHIEASDSPGFLYGVYGLLMKLRLGTDPSTLEVESAPAVGERILNHWDNMDGSVERGYSGKSLFFRNGSLSYDPERITDYARLLASVGVNRLSVNNVNVTLESARLITEERLPEMAALAALFRPFGIRLIIAVDFESPKKLGALPTADPFDPDAAKWWQAAADTVYRHIPDLAGFVVKTDSEFRDGPATFGRTQADGANVIAKALQPFGGTVYWRCFVYNCRQDWRDYDTDRPKAAFEHFYPLDGKFDENVILQIKNGPSDFQVREPNSPLFGRMPKTRQAVEFQVTQEYTGQQIDLYALAVQWEEFYAAPVSKNRLTGELVGKDITAVAGVANAGDDGNWTGHLLAQANLFAFGRMAWNPGVLAKDVIREWAGLTFGNEPRLVAPLTDIMAASRGIYEKYTAPLGIGWMVNVNNHYGPSIDGYEYMRWGTYHRADHLAIGVDRTSRGTGFTGQYDPWLAAIYDDTQSCPESLLLFFHRLPYSHRLKSGKTLIQHIYDSHFEGAEEVRGLLQNWESLRPLLPEAAFASVAERLKRQLENALEWRDVVNTYFYRKTGVPDEQGRRVYP